jgi:hypothetical protein
MFSDYSNLEEVNSILDNGRQALSLNNEPSCKVVARVGYINEVIGINEDITDPKKKDWPQFYFGEFMISPVFHITSTSNYASDSIRVIIQHALCYNFGFMNLSFRVWFKKDGGKWCSIKTGKDCLFPKPHCITFETCEVNGLFLVTYDKLMLHRLCFKILPGILLLGWMFCKLFK